MPIRVEVMGTNQVVEFPDGTSQEVMQEAMQRFVRERGLGQPPATQPQDQQMGPPPQPGDPAFTGPVRPPQEDPSFAGSGVIEPTATIASSIVAEPIAGLAGIGAGLVNTGAEALGFDAPFDRAGDVVQQTREALTFQPRTQEGRESLQAVGETLAPVGEAFKAVEEGLGDSVFDATGSPALAAAATSIPTAVLEAIGVGASKRVAKSSQAVKRLNEQKRVAKSLSEAAPSIDQLKDASRGVFKEIDDAGITIKPEAYADLVADIEKSVVARGLDADVTPKAAKALQRFQQGVGGSPSLGDVETLRAVAQNAASALEDSEKMLGSIMIDSVDSFLDKAGSRALIGSEEAVSQVGKKYRAARKLWGQAKKGEVMQEAFEKARNQASGFENGIRTQFRQILNNKKRSRFFSADELNQMKKVVQGARGVNLARFIGRMGFSEGSATNLVGTAVGAGGGAAAFGTPGAIGVPLIGQFSRNLAARLTAESAEFADDIIRAGRDGRQIVKAYLKNTPKKQRSAQELSELLIRGDIDLSDIPAQELAQQAANLASQRRAGAAGALAAGASTEEINQGERQ